ncbi:MAG: hypothetical protein NVS2B3_09100 [Vulcanimicrobiaceae bacterium]
MQLYTRALSHPRDPFVHHGSVSVERSLDKAFVAAERYLRGDSIMARTFDDLERGPNPIVVRGNRRDDDHFEPTTRTVAWDPYSALRTTDGGWQSPALGLGHELVHADADPASRARLSQIRSPRYDNAEERRVIRGAETHAARTLGESIRHDHAGATFRVTSPTSRFDVAR